MTCSGISLPLTLSCNGFAVVQILWRSEASALFNEPRLPAHGIENFAAFSSKVLASGAEGSQQAELGSHQQSTLARVSWCGTRHISSSLPLKIERAARCPHLLRGQFLEK